MSTLEKAGPCCGNCGKQCAEGDSFCPACGMPLHSRKNLRVREKTPRSPIVSRILAPRFFLNAAILLLSVLILLTALLPLATVDLGSQFAELGLPVRADVDFSGIDFLTFFFDQLHNDTEKELEESRLADRILDTTDEITQEFAGLTTANDLTLRQRRLIDRYVHQLMRLMLRSEDTPFSPSILLAGVTALLYMIFAVAFFTFALLNLLLHLFGRRDLSGAALRFLCMAPGLTLALYFAARVTLGHPAGVRPAGTVIACVIAAVAVILAAMIIGLATRTVRFRTGALVRTSCVSVFAFVMLCVLLLSPLSVKLTGCFGAGASGYFPDETGTETGGTTTQSVYTVRVGMDWSFFDSISMTKKDLEDFNQTADDALNGLADYERSDYSRGLTGATGALHTASACVLRLATGDGSGMGVFAYLPVLALLTAFAAAWVLGEGFLYLATGRSQRNVYLAAKLTAVALSLLLLIALIVTVIVFNLTAGQSNFVSLAENEVFAPLVGTKGVLRRIIGMSIGAAPIVVTVLALLALLLPPPAVKCSDAVTLPMPEEEETPVAL